MSKHPASRTGWHLGLMIDGCAIHMLLDGILYRSSRIGALNMITISSERRPIPTYPSTMVTISYYLILKVRFHHSRKQSSRRERPNHILFRIPNPANLVPSQREKPAFPGNDCEGRCLMAIPDIKNIKTRTGNKMLLFRILMRLNRPNAKKLK